MGEGYPAMGKLSWELKQASGKWPLSGQAMARLLVEKSSFICQSDSFGTPNQAGNGNLVVGFGEYGKGIQAIIKS